MAIKNSYPATVSYPPEMEVRELRVDTTAGTDDLTPATGKQIRVLGFFATMFVDSGVPVTTSLRATLAFGTGHNTVASKILAGYRQGDQYDDAGACMCGINVVGDVNEVVRLTNVTHAGGANAIITRCNVFYIEE